MPTKPTQHAEVNQAVQGLITEASRLNFPPQASADEVNFELYRTGLRKRRLGMDFEDGYGTHIVLGGVLADLDTAGRGSFVWLSANGDPNNNFICVQVGDTVHIYNRDADNISPAGPIYSLQLVLDGTKNFSFASTEGLLVVVAGNETIATVSYIAGGSPPFVVEYIRILTRDLWGVEETLNTNFETDPSYRGTLNAQHVYNLHNQSWGIPRKDQAGTTRDAIGMFQNDLGPSPSNSEQVWAGLQFQAVGVNSVSNQQPFERMFTNMYNDTLGAKTVAAKGYFIIDALQRGSSRVAQFYANKAKYPQLSGDISVPADYTQSGPSVAAEFAGRIFYAGFNGEVAGPDRRSPNLLNYIFFTQLVKSKAELPKCYQEGDPTSRDTSDVVDTDGGFLRIAGAQKILAMRAIGINLAVIATNGVWLVTGGTTDSGFSATNYKVSKISNFGGLSSSSVVVENDSIFYWSSDGIYQIARNQLGDYGVQSITLNTIQSLYVDIPNASKIAAFGEYDQINKKIRWIYKSGARADQTLVTKELILDTALGAFTQNEINNLTGYPTEIIGVVQTALTITSTNDVQVFSSTDLVMSNTDIVVVDGLDANSNVQFLRYATILVQAGIPLLTFSYYHNSEFADWFSLDGIGVDAKAHCLTGDVIGGDSSVDKQTPYLVMHFVRTEEGVGADLVPLHQSSCLYRGQWNFANAVQSMKWSPLRQAYRYRHAQFTTSLADPFDNGFAVVTSKNKLRGKGRAFALYFETEAGKDCQIIGWNISVNANQAA